MRHNPLSPKSLFQQFANWLRDRHIFGLLGTMLVGVLLGLLLANEPIRSWLQSVAIELVSIMILFFLLETLARTRSQLTAAQQEAQRARDLERLQRQISAQIRQELRSYIQGQETARLRAARSTEERQPILDSMRVGGLLKGAELLGTALSGTRLPNAELQRAILRQAAMKQTDLRDADLEQADLWQADLQGAKLNNTKLFRANLYMAQLQQADLQRADLTQANLGQADLQEATLGEAQIDRANLWGANLSQADFERASLRGAVMVEANLQRALLWHANLEGAILLNADLNDADLTDCNLRGARFMTVEQLSDKYLRSVTLPDGVHLPDDDRWKAAFTRWLEAAVVDENGFIIPNYSHVDLSRLPRFTINYLANALSLQGAILPDGTRLPDNKNWQRVFERWAQSAEVDSYAHIIPGVEEDLLP